MPDNDVVLPPPVVNGTGTFIPPGEPVPPPPPVSPEKAKRDLLLIEHKLLGRKIAEAKARRAEIEDELTKIDAVASLAMKLAALSPAERELLEAQLSASLQRRLDAEKAAADPETPAPETPA